MSIRNLSYLFKPRSIALVGASREQGSFGAVIARNLFHGGFTGPIMPVNPRYRAIEGVLTYPDAESLPEVPDLVVIATPPPTVPDLIDRFADRGARAAVVISSGFGEGGDAAGERLRASMLAAAGRHGMRIIGPNSIGVMVPGGGLNAGLAHVAPTPGQLAFVTQSAAIATSVLDWASARSIGFSHVVSLGDMSDVDFGDMLDYLAREADVRGILLYMEAVKHARKFMSAGRSAARLKPVVVIKAGRHPASAGAVASHAGALAGTDAVYDAAFRRAGMLRVSDIGDLFGAVETLNMGRRPSGDRLAILTNGGGIGLLAADAWLARKGRLAELRLETKQQLKAFLPSGWSHGNPIDILGDATGEKYARALDVVLHDEGADAVLVLKCPSAIGGGEDAARAVTDAARKSKRCILTCWLGEDAATPARQLFAAHRIPTYFTPERSVRAFSDILSYWQNQELLTQTPASVPEEFTPDTQTAGRIIAAVVEAGRQWLMEPEAKDVLRAYDIPIVETRVATDPGAAAEAAAEMDLPVVLKILSPDIIHKSDAGGVMPDLHAPAAVRAAATTMIAAVRRDRPEARIEGFTVQPMVKRPQAFELIIGVSEDDQFGPVILFGHGGTEAEIVNDTALALPPLNMHLGRELMSRTRIFTLLQGYRGRPAAAIDDIALTLIKISQLIIDFPEIVELDINPLLVDATGVVALDARLRVRASDAVALKRLAIRPYPSELEEILSLPDGRKFLLRPVRPEDEPAFQGLFEKLSAEDIRLRFFAPKRALSHPFAARLTQIDYDREMALVLAEPGPAGRSEVFGAIHITADPDGEQGEFAIMLRSDMVGLGLGPLLMRRMIDYARSKGLQEIIGDVLRENRPMLRLCDFFHFKRTPDEDDPSVVQVHLKL